MLSVRYGTIYKRGCADSKDYGDDSPLYGAMGFIRKSDRASGLTRKTKTPTKG